MNATEIIKDSGFTAFAMSREKFALQDLRTYFILRHLGTALKKQVLEIKFDHLHPSMQSQSCLAILRAASPSGQR